MYIESMYGHFITRSFLASCLSILLKGSKTRKCGRFAPNVLVVNVVVMSRPHCLLQLCKILQMKSVGTYYTFNTGFCCGGELRKHKTQKL